MSFFFFQAEDGIRDLIVTGVQTCALPISVHRWLNDGFIAGEQVTPGAPWQIRINDELRSRFVEQAPPGYLPMLETTMKLGVSRQTVLQRETPSFMVVSSMGR